MIQSYIDTTPVVLASNSSAVAFQRDCIRTRNAYCQCGGWLNHSEGSPLYKITKGGRYKIELTGNVSSATAGVIALGVYVDGVLAPGSEAIVTLATAGDYENISISKTIEVCCDATITIQAIPTVITPTDVTTPITTQIPIITNANLQINRKC